ncbi:hypothetical protein DFH09DRAFT_1460819 [Mycena vulgaris]|nr:hypothetical protein DFH09DRAFT_1460819 [Mycena vulgaris]
MTASGSAPAAPTGIAGPSACAVRSQSGSQSSASPTLTTDPCGSTPVHPRDFALSVRAPTDPASAKLKGEQIWAQIAAATADKSPALTTDKFRASYSAIFTVADEIPTNVRGGEGMDIASLFNTVTVGGPDLPKPLFSALPDTLHRVENEGTVAYELIFTPGVIVASYSFKEDDPIRPRTAQVNWDVIAMELYKDFKGVDGPTDLRFVMRLHIVNPVTIGVLEELYANSQMSAQASANDIEWTQWDANDGKCGTDAVLTLLGTDNGSGAGFMLIDYHATLGGKRIINVYTRRQNGCTHWIPDVDIKLEALSERNPKRIERMIAEKERAEYCIMDMHMYTPRASALEPSGNYEGDEESGGGAPHEGEERQSRHHAEEREEALRIELFHVAEVAIAGTQRENEGGEIGEDKESAARKSRGHRVGDPGRPPAFVAEGRVRIRESVRAIVPIPVANEIRRFRDFAASSQTIPEPWRVVRDATPRGADTTKDEGCFLGIHDRIGGSFKSHCIQAPHSHRRSKPALGELLGESWQPAVQPAPYGTTNLASRLPLPSNMKVAPACRTSPGCGEMAVASRLEPTSRWIAEDLGRDPAQRGQDGPQGEFLQIRRKHKHAPRQHRARMRVYLCTRPKCTHLHFARHSTEQSPIEGGVDTRPRRFSENPLYSALSNAIMRINAPLCVSRQVLPFGANSKVGQSVPSIQGGWLTITHLPLYNDTTTSGRRNTHVADRQSDCGVSGNLPGIWHYQLRRKATKLTIYPQPMRTTESSWYSEVQHQSYLSAVGEGRVASQMPQLDATVNARPYSMAELNAGSAPLPRHRDATGARRTPLDDSVLSSPTTVTPFSMAELNAGSAPFYPDRARGGMQSPRPSGLERRIEKPAYYQLQQAAHYEEPFYHLPSGSLDHKIHSARNACSPTWWSYPIPEPPEAAPLSAEELAVRFPPYMTMDSCHYPFDASPLASCRSNVASSETFFSLTSSTTSASLAPPPVLFNVRRRKYYGAFEACSRQDVFPEFSDNYAPGAEEELLPDLESRWAQLRALANWKAEVQDGERKQREENAKNAIDDGDEAAKGWSLLEMERHTTGVRNRLLAAYHTNPAASGPATALRGLPLVVEARPVYPTKFWRGILLELEMKSEWMSPM